MACSNLNEEVTIENNYSVDSGECGEDYHSVQLQYTTAVQEYIDFGSVYIDSTTYTDLVISNVGENVLDITNIVSDNTIFTTNKTTFSIEELAAARTVLRFFIT